MTTATAISTLSEIISERLDFDQILELKDLSWSEVCDKLELGNGFYEMMNDGEAKYVIEAIVQDAIDEKEAVQKQADEINADLKAMQNWHGWVF